MLEESSSILVLRDSESGTAILYCMSDGTLYRLSLEENLACSLLGSE